MPNHCKNNLSPWSTHNPFPHRLHGDDPLIAGVAEPLPGDEGPGPAQDGTLLAADGGVGAEAGDQVPGAPRGESQDGGGAVHGLGDGAHAAGDAVDEGILEVRVVRTLEVLGVGAKPIHDDGSPHHGWLERVGGLVAAALERNVLEIRGVGMMAERTLESMAWLDARAPALAMGPRDVEDVGDVSEGARALTDI